ncbi:MAG: hypothetical protein Q8R02_04350 [Hyphomonadaceae bacterium]|nr:hypothetical protein [Hyphomonadaceae bacterium]
MNPPDASSPGSMESAARMFVVEMRRERRSFWAILLVFFLLLAIMFAYNLVALSSLSGDQRREEFRSKGENAGALAEVLSQQNTAAYAQAIAQRETQEAQKTDSIAAFRRALRDSPDTLVSAAERYAVGHLYGRSLNSSTAAVVAGALESKKLSASQRALLNAALFDWGMPNTMSEVSLGEAQQQVERNTKVLLADPKYAAYGHAAKTGFWFRKANSGEMYMDWNNGCKELVDDAQQALKAAQAVATKVGSAQASGLNLNYWHGQCRRRHGEPVEALKDFQAMMKVVGAEDFPATNPYKFQAFHGLAMATMALPVDSGVSGEERTQQVQSAIDMLELAGEYRGAAGHIASGQTSSLGNIGILTLRKTTPDKYVEALEYTEKVDGVTASTWNLVGRLVAIRAMQKPDAPAISDPVLSAKYSRKELKKLAFNTLAKLAYLSSDFPEAEFKRLLDEQHYDALAEVKACINKKIDCFQTMKK